MWWKLLKSTDTFLVSTSICCAILPGLAEALVCSAAPDINLVFNSLVSASAIVLMRPLPDSGTRSGTGAAILLVAAFGACVAFGAGGSYGILPSCIILPLHVLLSFVQRYSRVRILFRQKEVWYTVESQYRMIGVTVLLMLAVLAKVLPSSRWHLYVLSVLAALLYIVRLLRMWTGRIYLLGSSKERVLRALIEGSVSEHGPQPKKDGAISMQRLFEKVTLHMEKERPYLNDSFSLEDLASAVYTNKTYLSKTINVMSGKNFRQFINTYRVRYSVDLLEKNPRLRVEELAAKSGFHSSVTFNMAFKSNMSETPGEYCQRFRSNLL